MNEATALNFTAQYALPATATEWWTVLTEGEWHHPVYGKMRFSKQRLQRFVDNFKAHAYGQDLPLDVNHMSSDQGAPGWITDLRVTEVEGKSHLQIRPELNSYGDMLISDNRVRYVSASFCEEWTSPEGRKVRDLLVAVALTERPFFKHLGGIHKHAEQATGDDPQVMFLIEEAGTMGANADQGKQGNQQTPAAPPPAAPAAGNDPVTLAELQRQLAEQQTQFAALQQQYTGLQTQNQQLTQGLLQERHGRELSELTAQLAGTNLGSETNPYRLAEVHANRWAGHAMTFSDTAPVDAENKPVMLSDGKPAPSPRAAFLADLKALASGLVPGGVKGMASPEAPDGGSDGATAAAKLNEKIAAKQAAAKAAGVELDYTAALIEVAREDAALVEAARTASR